MTTKPLSRTREIPLSKLVPSEANVRRTGRDVGIAQLAASIAAHGLIQSLSVRPLLDAKGKETGQYAVSGGNRRLAALKLLAKRKEIAKNHLLAIDEAKLALSGGGAHHHVGQLFGVAVVQAFDLACCGIDS